MHVAELGVVLFLFVIGLELNLSRLWAMRRDIFGLGAAQLVITGLLAMSIHCSSSGRPWQAPLIAGLGLALSSTALVMQLLEERGEVQSPHGQKAFAILLFQDLAVVPLLALVAILSPTGGRRRAVWLSALKMVGAVGDGHPRGALSAQSVLSHSRQHRRARDHDGRGAARGDRRRRPHDVRRASLRRSARFSPGIMLAESSYRHELEADIEPFRGFCWGSSSCPSGCRSISGRGARLAAASSAALLDADGDQGGRRLRARAHVVEAITRRRCGRLCTCRKGANSGSCSSRPPFPRA